MFCEDLLHVGHTALLPGSALLLPDDDYSARCSYVDLDGEKAPAASREKPAMSEAEDAAFAEANFEIMLDGVRNIGRYVGEIRKGNRPAHK